MKVEVAVLGSIVRTVSVDVKQHRTRTSDPFRAQELCESRGGHPGLPVPNSVYGLCGRKVTLNYNCLRVRAQELCESRGGLPVPNSPFGL